MVSSEIKDRMRYLITGGATARDYSAGRQQVNGHETRAEGDYIRGVADMNHPTVATAHTGELRNGGVATGNRIRTEGRTIENEVIDRKVFTKTVDHQVLVEKKIYELEHHPVQQQFVVETRLVGARPVAGKPTEYVGTESREVERRTKDLPHGDRKVVVHDVDVEEYEERGRTSESFVRGWESEGRTRGWESTSGTADKINLQSYGIERPAIIPLRKLQEIS